MHTPSALRLYVSYLCDKQKFSYKTIEGVRSAFKNHFDEMGFEGNEWKETSPGVWQGNPVFEHEFVKMIKTLKPQGGGIGISKRSLPMLYNDMTKLMAHLQDPVTIKEHGVGACLMFQAFAATGFMLWTKNEELVGLKGKDISSIMRTESDQPFFTITLTFRETNSSDGNKGHIYEIHPTPSEPDSCCFTKLLAWLDWLENQTHRRPGPRISEEIADSDLARDARAQEDYTFPALDSIGRVRVRDPITYPRIQEYLDVFTNNNKVLGDRKGKFTSQSLRRGGAQFRFMFAEKKWSLKAVKCGVAGVRTSGVAP